MGSKYTSGNKYRNLLKNARFNFIHKRILDRLRSVINLVPLQLEYKMNIRNTNRRMSGNEYIKNTYYIMKRNRTQRILILLLTHTNFSTHTNILWTSTYHAKILWTDVAHTTHAKFLTHAIFTPFF